MQDIEFDGGTERFKVTLASATAADREAIEAAVTAQGAAGGYEYVLTWVTAEESIPPADTPAPSLTVSPFRLPTLDGAELDLGPLLGSQPIVLVFWASWCAPCVTEAPHLVRLHETYGPRGVAFVSVAEDAPAQVPKLRALVKRLGIDYPVALDSDGQVLAGIQPGGSVPLTLVLDASGQPFHTSRNFEAGDEVALEAAIVEVASPVSTQP